jgi:hypothetical protein
MNTVIRNTNKPNPVFIEDIFRPMSDEELIAQWHENLDVYKNFSYRDSLLEEMKRRELRPDAWAEERDRDHGLYPNIYDPEFAKRLYQKTEYAALASMPAGEETCGASVTSFMTTAVQRLVARFLHPMTPYNGLLLDHGVGVGKTCSAITVAETFLEIAPQNTVYILAPSAIATGFRRTIFDVNKLLPATKEELALTGEYWKSPQCTGMTYLRLAGVADNPNKEVVEKEVERIVRRRYKIMGYLEFANMIIRKFNTIPGHLSADERNEAEKAMLHAMFSDHLLIIDEAHNLRDSDAEIGGGGEVDPSKLTDAAEGRRTTPIIKKIVTYAEGLRLMLMTATPMYDTAPEIMFLLNLLILNDTKDPYDDTMFLKDVFNLDGTLSEDGEAKLSRVVRRYVSYMRGENPNTFPLRLTPSDCNAVDTVDSYPTISMNRKESVVRMSEDEKKIFRELPLLTQTVVPETRVGMSLIKILRDYANPSETGEASEVSDFVLNDTLQMGNITYPNGMYGMRGFERYFKEEVTNAGGTKVKRYIWSPPDDDADRTIESVFGPEGLRSHAPKIASIVEHVLAGRGMSFLYSRFVKPGAIPMAIALELAGLCRVLSDGTPAPLLKNGPKPTGYYVLLTSDDQLSPAFGDLLKYATTFPTENDALEGTRVRAIIGSKVTAEGLDLKCIRQVHILDGWYHLNRIEQIIGRGVRFCSHTVLRDMGLRNCLIYLHALAVPEYETADLYVYRLAVRKALPIGRVTRLLKINAWDCMLNYDAIALKDVGTRNIVDALGNKYDNYDLHDKPFTSFCDFMETCTYTCPGAGSEMVPNEGTYKVGDFRYMFAERAGRLAAIFMDEVAVPLSFIKETVYEDIPWSMAASGLREVLGRMKFRRRDGLIGTLELRNNYIVFQPLGVTDMKIPLALRYGSAYGRMARTITPQRPFFTTAAPVPADAPVAEDAVVVAPGDHTRALADLAAWNALVQRMIHEEQGAIEPPTAFGKEMFYGWRWLFHHFGSLPETPNIAAMWYMDNIWTADDRNAVLAQFAIRGRAAMPADLAKIADLLRPVELFSGGISGYLHFDNKTLKAIPYCVDGGAAKECTTILKDLVDNAIGKPVNRDTDTGRLFGFLVTKSGVPVFKTVDKVEGDKKGAECSNTPNLANHERRILVLHSMLREGLGSDPVLNLLLDNDPTHKASDAERKARQDAVKHRYDPKVKAKQPELDLLHVGDMSLKQVCPYMEFILRLMDMRRIQGKRWFLSVVDAARAGFKMT